MTKVLRKRRFKIGYEVRREVHQVGEEEQEVEISSAYDHRGQYLGDPRTARHLIVKKGIQVFEKTDPAHCVCSIGFNPNERKWYGWSHRAIYGFGIGHVVKEGDSTTTSGWTDEYLAEHPEAERGVPAGFKVHTLADAKRVAIAFAESVS